VTSSTLLADPPIQRNHRCILYQKGILRKDLCAFVILPRWILLRMRTVSNNRCIENQNTHFVISNCFTNSCRLRNNLENSGKTNRPQMAVWCMPLSHAGYLRLQTHTLRISDNYCFSIVKMVAGNLLNMTLYAHWLCGYLLRVLFLLRRCNNFMSQSK